MESYRSAEWNLYDMVNAAFAIYWFGNPIYIYYIYIKKGKKKNTRY